MDWDPTSGRQGLDLLVLREGGIRFDSAQRVAGLLIPSTATESIDRVKIPFKRVAGASTMQLDVIPVASAIPTITT